MPDSGSLYRALYGVRKVCFLFSYLRVSVRVLPMRPRQRHDMINAKAQFGGQVCPNQAAPTASKSGNSALLFISRLAIVLILCYSCQVHLHFANARGERDELPIKMNTGVDPEIVKTSWQARSHSGQKKSQNPTSGISVYTYQEYFRSPQCDWSGHPWRLHDMKSYAVISPMSMHN